MSSAQAVYSVPRLLINGLTRKRQSVEQFQPSSIKVSNFYCNSKQLESFQSVFGDPIEIPTFAFISSFKLIGQCLVQSSIPSKLMGLIHLRSLFTIHKNQNWLLPSDIEISIDELIEDDKGLNYKVTTKFFQGGELTVENNNWMLDKKRGYKANPTTSVKQEDITLGKALCSTAVNIGTAWKYAKLSGDFNPIHLHPFLAKKFGLRNALIHGMFNAHYSLSEIKKLDFETVSTIDIQFNKPCFLPSQVFLRQYGEKREYGLFGRDADERFLKITLD